ncbi:branched-chain amino acid ABC transporter substrate-binding protein [Pollutimonas bauzanensis]|uniref:Amino acid/amide ABC transporter substrate-binding protein, HAAT family (TC 3.A.1.4.-) n=1 Tax=Pollutimonas bauzanensis TaxID=658167 RepID=A0A1M5SF52_9BURK|nr:branched-chain amino acid ABC transporter substrate-binding protein [Pollutimonas bauzanensis]SHH37050.1 amino acid/amide ABC transporter substrate-binding protein, HAAT family (TC 3.A.1.4.-) [Pollutimonas bauzanensis]
MKLHHTLTCTLSSSLLLASTLAVAAPVKIAVLETLSGPQASTGLTYRTAARYAVDKMNADGGWNGEKVQLVEYDNQGGPAGAADKLRAAIADGVQIIVQGASSAIGGQITEDIRKHNLRNPGKELIYLNVGAEALELTGQKCQFYHFRVAGNAQVRVKALIAGMKQADALGARVYSINQNYSWGQDMEQAIVDNAAAGGYQVVEKTLHDVNKVQDFAPYVNKIAATNADTVMTGNWSNDLLLLMKATKAAGLKARFGTVYLDQPGNIANAGDLALGHFVVQAFNAEAAGAAGAAFVDDYKAKAGHAPSFIEPQTVFGLMMVAEAMGRVKPQDGKLNVQALARELEKTSIETPMGKVSMRPEDHQALMPMVVSMASKDASYKVDGTDLGFKPVKTFSADEAATPAQSTCKMQRPG